MNEYQEQYYWSLIDTGLPEVYARMAAPNYIWTWHSASGSLGMGFVWENTPEGHSFWEAIATEFERW